VKRHCVTVSGSGSHIILFKTNYMLMDFSMGYIHYYEPFTRVDSDRLF